MKVQTLFERMTQEMRDAVKSGVFNNTDDIWRDDAIKALNNKTSFNDLKFKELVAITHFTHPDKVANLNEIINLFRHGE